MWWVGVNGHGNDGVVYGFDVRGGRKVNDKALIQTIGILAVVLALNFGVLIALLVGCK